MFFISLHVSQIDIALTGGDNVCERVLFAMSLAKNKLRNSITDKLLNHWLMAFIE
jgi:hypothetical protein